MDVFPYQGKALDKALEQSCELFKKHGRHSARKVLIVFTNGKSSGRANELKKHAQILTDMNTKLIVVAVGDDVSVEELLDVTSNEESIVRIQPEDDHQELFASIVSINIEGNLSAFVFIVIYLADLTVSDLTVSEGPGTSYQIEIHFAVVNHLYLLFSFVKLVET